MAGVLAAELRPEVKRVPTPEPAVGTGTSQPAPEAPPKPGLAFGGA